MTSFCFHKDANISGWKDSPVESATPAIQTHVGERPPAAIHGAGPAAASAAATPEPAREQHEPLQTPPASPPWLPCTETPSCQV